MSLNYNIQQLQPEALLKEKQNLFDKMIKENKEFDEVRILFQEIRQLERNLKQQSQTVNNVSTQMAGQ